MTRGSVLYNWYVYFIIIENGLVKIGHSSEPSTRKDQLQTGCPSELKLFHRLGFETKDDAAYFERVLHSFFASYRTHGEWFDFGTMFDIFWPYIENLWSAFNLWVETKNKIELTVILKFVVVCEQLYEEIDRLESQGFQRDAEELRERLSRMEEISQLKDWTDPSSIEE